MTSDRIPSTCIRASKTLFALLLVMTLAKPLRAADGDDLDAYKFRVSGVWWFSHPTGSFSGSNESGSFDLNKDFHFGNYSTFTGVMDWRFKRKHHLTFLASPVLFNRTVTANRTIEFQGKFFDVGTQVSADIKSFNFAPGYQYDIIRRNHGFLAVATQVNLLYSSASLSGMATVNGQTGTQTADGSFFAGLPVVGPRGRWYPLNSDRFAVEGSLLGMYFFGYGNFVSARGAGLIGLTHHWKASLGYQMGSRLRINGTNDRLGVRLTQKGPVAGVEASW
jgi:hypothetical protein